MATSSDTSFINEQEESGNSTTSPEEQSIYSSSEESMCQWTPISELSSENKKELTSPFDGNICDEYISMSHSSIVKHPLYGFRAVADPGIEEALLGHNPPITYPDDGQELYLHLCSEMNLCPVTMFYNNLLSPVNNLSYYGVDPNGVRAMAMALEKNKTVTCLNMTDNFLNDDACYHLGKMLQTNTTLQELILEGCRIGASGMLRLGDDIYLNHSLVSLNLARNDLTDAGGVIFANQLANGVSIKKLNLSKNGLGRETASALVEVLYWNVFTHLDLSWNNFAHVPSTVKMLDLLANSEFIQEFNLSFNSLDDDRVAGAICNVLNIPALTVLDLSHNQLKGEAIHIITAGLTNAQNLITLNLSYNPMAPEDAYHALQIMLTPEVKLQELLMDNVCVKKSFLVLLARVSRMEFRKDFIATYGHVLQNWIIEGPDPRALLLKRAEYLGKNHKLRRTDIILYFMRLNKECSTPVETNALVDLLRNNKIPLTEDFVKELAVVFAGPDTKKSHTVDLNLITEYIKRLWPDKTVPVTPPPEPEPIPEPVKPIPPVKTKQKKAKGKS